jgi:hypothetical protein
MEIAHTTKGLVSGVILNDIGPEVTQGARGQVRDYLEIPPEFASWDCADRVFDPS